MKSQMPTVTKTHTNNLPMSISDQMLNNTSSATTMQPTSQKGAVDRELMVDDVIQSLIKQEGRKQRNINRIIFYLKFIID